MKIYRLFLLSLPLLHSCSVFENRDACPSLLHIVFPGEDPSQAILHLDIDDGNTSVFAQDVCPSDYPDGLILKLPKGEYRMKSFAQSGGLVFEGGRLMLAPGGDASQFYACCETLDCWGETAVGHVMPAAQSAKLTVGLKGLNAEFTEMALHAGWNGLYLKDLSPAPGEYLAPLLPMPGDAESLSSEADFICWIPRQGDRDCSLSLSFSGVKLLEFDLGSFLASGGYDWNSVLLPEIYLGLEYYDGNFRVTALDWTYGAVIEEWI